MTARPSGLTLADLTGSPNALAPHYSRFRVSERLDLTGHSHQAWPDRGLEGQKRAWLDAAELGNGKWERAFAKADRVRRGFAERLDDEPERIALGANTHELVVRFLSGLPLRDRPRLVITDGEFHTIRRQLGRLEEEGLEVVRVSAHPASRVAERLSEAVDDRTAAVLVSSVFYRSAEIAQDLGDVMVACERVGAELLVDAYHSINVVPLSLPRERLEGAFVVGGGYKYCQLGEGNCFLRFPEGCAMRPIITGWYSEFSTHHTTGPHGETLYGEGPDRFAGATYDPTSHYRAAEVFDFFSEQGLDPALLREVSQHQIGLLTAGFDALDADPDVVSRDRALDLSEIGGFLALRTSHAAELSGLLRDRGVSTDYRDDTMRMGPAPYLADSQLEDAVSALGDAIARLSE